MIQNDAAGVWYAVKGLPEVEVMAKVLKGDFTQKYQTNKQQRSIEDPIPGYQLKLSVAFSDPLIWRTIQVPGKMTLALLHKVIQVCRMG